MAKNIIKFDTAGIQKCAQQYKQYAEETEQITNDLQKALDDLLAKDWRGNAAEKFKKSFSEDWRKYVDRYYELLKEIADLFTEISAVYQEMEEQAKALKYQG